MKTVCCNIALIQTESTYTLQLQDFFHYYNNLWTAYRSYNIYMHTEVGLATGKLV